MRWLACVVASSVVSCAAVVSFDDYGTNAKDGLGRGDGGADAAPLYSVRGVVAGLESERATLILNGAPLEVGDGPFAFLATLAEGVDYELVVRDPPGHACSVEDGRGTIGHGDVGGVLVKCISRDAMLSSLAFSVGELSPSFKPEQLDYGLRVRVPSGLFSGPPPPTNLRIIATAANPAATIAIGGTAVASGVPSAPFTLAVKGTPLDITVTAPDGQTKTRYGITAAIASHDYIKASDPSRDVNFGVSLALSGDTLAVGSNADAVYVFKRYGTTWSQEAKLSGPYFGASVALDGDTLAVGSVQAVYVFTRSGKTWSPQATLGAGISNFIYSVALSGDSLAVGLNEQALGVSAHVYSRAGATWSDQATLQPSNVGPSALGTQPSLALAGDTLALGWATEPSAAKGIGGDSSDTSAPGAGAVYVFQRLGTTWSQQAYVKASNTQTNASFGSSLSLHGSTLAVGAADESTNTQGIDGDQNAANNLTSSGAVYVFTRAGAAWSQQAYVKAGDASGQTRFGDAVALAGDQLVVGAPYAFSGGAVYTFIRSGAAWYQRTQFQAPVVWPYAQFGNSLGLFDGTIAVGSPFESSGAAGVNGAEQDNSLTNAGAVHVF